MPVKLRLLLFWFFVMLFFILLPIFMLISLGYRMNWQTHRFERLGMISIKTVPDEASITLNQKLLRKKSPLKLANLFPGTYSLYLDKKGFKAWKGNVIVKPNWVSRLESVILFPENIEIDPVTDLNVHSVYLSPKSRKLIMIAESGDDKGMWIQDLFLGEETLFLTEREMGQAQISLHEDNAVLEFLWSRDERAFLIKKSNRYFLADLKRPNKITDLKDLLGIQPEEVYWDEQNSELFYFLYRGEIGKYYFRKKKKDDGLASGIITFVLKDQYIYYIEKVSGTLWRSLTDFRDEQKINEVPDFDRSHIYRIVVNPATEILAAKHLVDVWEVNGNFYELGDGKKYENVKDAIWDKSGKILFLNQGSSGVLLYDFSPKENHEHKLAEVKIPRNCKSLFWFDSNKLIFLTVKNIYLYQTGIDSVSYLQKIFDFDSSWDQVIWDARFRQLYYLKKNQNEAMQNLFRINLAHGALRKIMQNVRETMSDGIQLLNEVGKK